MARAGVVVGRLACARAARGLWRVCAAATRRRGCAIERCRGRGFAGRGIQCRGISGSGVRRRGLRAAGVLAGAGAAVRVIRTDARIGCAPRTTNLPPKATAGIECVVGSNLVDRVASTRSRRAGALAAYIARMAGYGVALRSGDCATGKAGTGLDARRRARTRAATSRGGPVLPRRERQGQRPGDLRPRGRSGRWHATSACWAHRRRSSRSSTGRTPTRTASTHRCLRRRGSA